MLALLEVIIDNFRMTENKIAIKAVREVPDDCSIDEISDRIEFLAAIQKGLDQFDRGEGIPHDEIKKQLASWLTN
jgi:predicted transcriptional regulator